MKRGDVVSWVERRRTVHGLVQRATGSIETASVDVICAGKSGRPELQGRFPHNVVGVGQLWRGRYLLCAASDEPRIRAELEALVATRHGQELVAACRRAAQEAVIPALEPTPEELSSALIAAALAPKGRPESPFFAPYKTDNRDRPERSGLAWTWAMEAYVHRKDQQWFAYRDTLDRWFAQAPVRWMVYAACEIAGLRQAAVAAWLGSEVKSVKNMLAIARRELDQACGWVVELPAHSWDVERDSCIAALRDETLTRLAAMGAPLEQPGKVRRGA